MTPEPCAAHHIVSNKLIIRTSTIKMILTVDILLSPLPTCTDAHKHTLIINTVFSYSAC